MLHNEGDEGLFEPLPDINLFALFQEEDPSFWTEVLREEALLELIRAQGGTV